MKLLTYLLAASAAILATIALSSEDEPDVYLGKCHYTITNTGGAWRVEVNRSKSEFKAPPRFVTVGVVHLLYSETGVEPYSIEDVSVTLGSDDHTHPLEYRHYFISQASEASCTAFRVS
jgi:hypothetical protein